MSTQTVTVNGISIPVLLPRPAAFDVATSAVFDSGSIVPVAALRTGRTAWKIGLTTALSAALGDLTNFQILGIRGDYPIGSSFNSNQFQTLHTASNGDFATPTTEFYSAYGLTITSGSTTQAAGSFFDIGMQVGTWSLLLIMAETGTSQQLSFTANAETPA